MRTLNLTLILLLLAVPLAAQEKGPADDLWPLYQEGRFEEVVTRGQALLATGTETAALNLAVGRSLVDLKRFEEGMPYLEKAIAQDTNRTWVYAWAQVYLGSSYLAEGNYSRAGQAWKLARQVTVMSPSSRSFGLVISASTTRGLT